MTSTDTAIDTAQRPGYGPALLAVARFLAAHPRLPEPYAVEVRVSPRTGEARVRVDLVQGADAFDSEHMVTAWALALGGERAEVTEHPDGEVPWTHYRAEGFAGPLKFRVVICHYHPTATGS